MFSREMSTQCRAGTSSLALSGYSCHMPNPWGPRDDSAAGPSLRGRTVCLSAFSIELGWSRNCFNTTSEKEKDLAFTSNSPNDFVVTCLG